MQLKVFKLISSMQNNIFIWRTFKLCKYESDVIMYNLDHYITAENEEPNPNVHLTGYIFK